MLWGVSLGGGHVLAAGAHRDDVAAVVSLTPLVDGMAAARLALKHHAPSSIARSTVAGVRSRLATVAGRGPVMMPVVGRPGEVAALSLPGHYESYLSIAGPTWRNEIDASVGMELGGHRPAKAAKHLRCPLLVQIADFDRSAPPHASAKAAFSGRGRGPSLPVRPLRRLAGRRVVRAGAGAPGVVPDQTSPTTVGCRRHDPVSSVGRVALLRAAT